MLMELQMARIINISVLRSGPSITLAKKRTQHRFQEPKLFGCVQPMSNFCLPIGLKVGGQPIFEHRRC